VTKQEEIRDEIKSIWLAWHGKDALVAPLVVKDILEYLRSRGVVILNERVQRFSEKTGQPIQPQSYEILESLIEERE